MVFDVSLEMQSDSKNYCSVLDGVMLDIPSQYMHYCLVLLCEVYCVIV